MVGRLDELRPELMGRPALALMLIIAVACSDVQARTPGGESVVKALPPTIDSILPPDEAIRRFVGGTKPPAGLEGGAASADELAKSLFDALDGADSAALARMVISRAEYGFLYYPTSLYAKKPYELAPDVAWMLSSEASAKGARRLLDRLGGRGLQLIGLRCARDTTEGRNQLRQHCSVAYRNEHGATERRQLFQAIIERDGAAKFLSYAGDF